MTTIDLAKRVYDHTWKLDPIVRSLLDTDFYKLLMLQMIWGLYPDLQVTFSLVNRTTHVMLAEEIDEAELRDQLDHARSLTLSKKEMIWLAGNSFYGRAHIFEPGFLAWLSSTGCRLTSCAATAGNTSSAFRAPGPRSPFGRSRRSPSSTRCGLVRP